MLFIGYTNTTFKNLYSKSIIVVIIIPVNWLHWWENNSNDSNSGRLGIKLKPKKNCKLNGMKKTQLFGYFVIRHHMCHHSKKLNLHLYTCLMTSINEKIAFITCNLKMYQHLSSSFLNIIIASKWNQKKYIYRSKRIECAL